MTSQGKFYLGCQKGNSYLRFFCQPKPGCRKITMFQSRNRETFTPDGNITQIATYEKSWWFEKDFPPPEPL